MTTSGVEADRKENTRAIVRLRFALGNEMDRPTLLGGKSWNRHGCVGAQVGNLQFSSWAFVGAVSTTGLSVPEEAAQLAAEYAARLNGVPKPRRHCEDCRSLLRRRLAIQRRA